MKKRNNKISGWPKLFCSFNAGIFLNIALTILPFGSYGSSWELLAMAGVVCQATLLPCSLLATLDGMTNASVSVAICSLILIFALLGTYIKKLLKENKTKDIAILGLREVIRLLEEKIK